MSIVILGYGPVGRATTALLKASGERVIVAQRQRPADLPEGIEFRPCDVLDAASVMAAVQGARQVVLAVGLPYQGKLWEVAWPRLMGHVLAACAQTRARLVFFDNLYMYGPQTRPLTEDMPLSSLPRKPAARSAATRLWQAAVAEGKVQVAALRAPDFFGPGVAQNSMLGATGFQALAQGKAATLVVPPDMPHDFAYVPDIGRAVVSLLAADEKHFGQAWHMPCAPTQSARQILALGAAAHHLPLKLRVIPAPLLSVMGLAMPLLRELGEMRFQWNRPYQVDATKFRRSFWGDVTPLETAAAETLASFRARA